MLIVAKNILNKKGIQQSTLLSI